MRIPFSYIWRSLWARRLTTLLTVTGVALVVFVFAGVLMLARGLQATLVETGAPDNVIVLRRSATSELVSQVDRNTASILDEQPEVAAATDGRPLVSKELMLVIGLTRKQTNALTNVSVRGVSPHAFELRPEVRVTKGRPFQFGTHEVVVAGNIARRFQGVAIGADLAFAGDHWTVVGLFEAGGTGFDSEIWGDVDQLMQASGRPVFSSVTLRLRDSGQPNTPKARQDSAQFTALKARLQADPRTQYAELKPERQYYREQSEAMATFIRILGLIVTIIFSVGAMIGAMITMYAAVANRVVEVGTLRALGFQRRSVLAAFLVESIVLAIIGGLVGVGLASLLSFMRVSTMNFSSFSEIGFGFSLSPGVVAGALGFAVVMGVVGGFLPAVRAARLGIVSALRAS
jgi:ABC-type lipoprotein release transport system permease subunit